MNIGLFISILGALSAITVSIIGAWLANRNNIVLQTRKLKEDHYIAFIEAIHNLAANNDTESTKKYVFARDKLLLIASEHVIKSILKYEDEAVGKSSELHDEYLTEIIKAIRIDLKLKDKDFPKISLRKVKKS